MAEQEEIEYCRNCLGPKYQHQAAEAMARDVSASGSATKAMQLPFVERGWQPPHRVEKLKEYVEALRDAGALVEAGIITEILDGGDPEYG